MKKFNMVFNHFYLIEGLGDNKKEDVAKDISYAFNVVMERTIALKRYLKAAANKETIPEAFKLEAFKPITVSKMSIVIGSKYVSKKQEGISLVTLKFNIKGYYEELKSILVFLDKCHKRLVGSNLLEKAA